MYGSAVIRTRIAKSNRLKSSRPMMQHSAGRFDQRAAILWMLPVPAAYGGRSRRLPCLRTQAGIARQARKPFGQAGDIARLVDDRGRSEILREACLRRRGAEEHRHTGGEVREDLVAEAQVPVQHR